MSDEEEKASFDATFYLRAGGSFTLRLTELNTRRSQLDGHLTECSWTLAEPVVVRLHTISLSEIAAITTCYLTDEPLSTPKAVARG